MPMFVFANYAPVCDPFFGIKTPLCWDSDAFSDDDDESSAYAESSSSFP